jgi:hypothetical protein
MHISESELSKRIDEAKLSVEIGGLYTHYKNPDRLYKVLGVAVTEADDTPCVIYQALHGEKITFVRPVKSWVEVVKARGELVPRFTPFQG